MRALWTTTVATSAMALGCAGGEPEPSAADGTLLSVICADGADGATEPDGFECALDRIVECGEGGVGQVERLEVRGRDCVGLDPRPVERGPFAPGEHLVDVIAAGGGEPLCQTRVTVVDTRPPEIIATWDHVLWPNDDRLHRVDPNDCVQYMDACSPVSHAHFTWVTSDEPASVRAMPYPFQPTDVSAEGCGEGVWLRAARDDAGNGRVYGLGWRVVDALGNAVEGTCRVGVPIYPPDGLAVKDADAYRVDIWPACAEGRSP